MVEPMIEPVASRHRATLLEPLAKSFKSGKSPFVKGIQTMEKEWNAKDWMDEIQPHWQEWLANVFGVQSKGTFIHLIKDRFTLSQEQADAIYLHLSTIKPENHG